MTATASLSLQTKEQKAISEMLGWADDMKAPSQMGMLEKMRAIASAGPKLVQFGRTLAAADPVSGLHYVHSTPDTA